MAITGVDGIVGGMKPPLGFMKASFTGKAAGLYNTLSRVAGQPAAATLGTPGVNGATVDYTNAIGGMFPWTNPGSGNSYLAKFTGSVGANLVGLVLYDMLWYNTGLVVTTTTAQSITTPTWPARDADGSTSGRGVEIWLWVLTATGNSSGISNTTISYTNAVNGASRTGTIVIACPATCTADTIIPFSLQGNDNGVQSIQSCTLGTSYVSGTLALVAVRRICSIMLPAASCGAVLDSFGCGFPQLFNGSALYLAVLLSGTAAGIATGEIVIAQG